MRRIPELRDLSEDHHHGLVLARRARTAARAADNAEAAWADIRARFEVEIEPHFQIEDDLIGPPLRHLGEVDLANRLATDHAALRDCVTDGGNLERFAALLESHIRFEERQLFEVVQDRFPQEALRAIGDACRQRLQREPRRQ